MLPLAHIRALSLLLPPTPEPERPFLNGLTVTASCTIGARSALAGAIKGGLPGLASPLFIPAEVVSKITGDVLAAAVDGAHVTLLTPAGVVSYEAAPVDARVMSLIRGVFPASTSGAVVQFDPDLISLFEDVAETLTGARLHLMSHGGQTKPAVITIPGFDDFVGVLMPRRVEGVAKTGCPEWVK